LRHWLALTVLLLGTPFAAAFANDWGNFAIISNTLGNNANRLCIGDANRVSDIGCPSYAPSLTTGGHVSITGNVSANKFIGDGSGLTNLSVQGDRIVSDTHTVIVHEGTGYVSLTTTGTTWGYLSSGWSYLANLFTNAVSSSLVSATNVSATYVDATRNGTVSGTYGYFRYISGTNIHGTFSGDGSGLTGIASGDRIASGTTSAIAYEDRSLTISTAGMQRMIVGENGNVGIGTATPSTPLHIVNSGSGNANMALQAQAVNGFSGVTLYDADNVMGASFQYGNASAGSGLANSAFVGSRKAGEPLYLLAGGTTRHVTLRSSGEFGIGTISPTATLQVSGTFTVSNTGQGESSPSLYVASAGQVGVGTSSPSAPLHVVRNDSNNLVASFEGVANANAYLNFKNSYSSPNGAGFTFSTSASTLGFFRYHFTSGYQFYAGGGAASNLKMSIQPDGNVGISTSTPLAKLDVAGTISASDAIQVGSSSLTCGAGIPGAMRYSSGNMQFCNGSAWTTLGSAGAATAASSTGAIQFNSANALAGDTTNLFWNDTNNRLGVGTSTPSTTLMVQGTQPGPTAGYSQLFINTPDNNDGTGLALRTTETGTERVWAIMAGTGGGSPNHNLRFYDVTAPAERMTLTTSGRLGIAKPSPLANVDVVGTISLTDALHLGQTTLACATGISGSIRYNTTSNTVQFCNGTGWTSLSSGTTGGSTAEGDRITSGTTVAVVNSDTTYISLSTGSTVWGYLSSATSYLPTLHAARVSATNISVTLAGFGNRTISNLGGPGGNFIASGTTSVSASSDGTIRLATAGSERLTINSSGQIGISNPAPTAPLQLGSYLFFGEGGGATATGPDIKFGTDGLVVSEGSMLFSIDALNATTNNYFSFGMNSLSASGRTELMRLTETGNLGIGTSPAVRLHVYGGTDASLSSGSGYVVIGSEGSQNIVVDTNEIISRDNGAGSTLYIQGAPGTITTIGYGAASTYSLEVGGHSASYVSRFINANTATGTDGIMIQAGPTSNPTTGSIYIRFRDGDGDDIASIGGNGSGGVAYNTTSDRRIKTDIVDTKRGLADLMQVRVRDYSPISNTSKRFTGYIAQELFEVFPDAVSKPENEQSFWSVDYGRITPLIIKAVQDLKRDTDEKFAAQMKAANDNDQRLREEIDQLRRELRELKQANKK
jgi:hypothetical protein